MIEAAVANPQYARTGEAFTALLPAFVTRVQGLDESFFARIDPMLADEQRERVPRARDLRTRTMLCNIDALGRFIGDSLPELREMLEELDPPPEILTPLIPTLAEHERKATIGVREIFDATMRLCGSLEPEEFSKDRLVDGVKSLRAMNRKLVDDLAPSLPADIARRWRGEFLARAYGYAAEASRVSALSRIDAALASKITDDERTTLEGLRAQAAALEADAMSKAFDLHDQDAIRLAGPGGAVDTSGYHDKLNSMRTDVMARDREISNGVTALLGAERVKALKPAHTRFSQSMGGLRYACGITVNVGRIYRPEESRGVPSSRSDPLIPAPLMSTDIEAICAGLGLAESQRAAALERFQTYSASLEETVTPLRDKAISASMSVRPPADAAQDPLAWAQKGDEARTRVRDAVRSATGQLLEDTRAIAGIPADDPAWLRIVRLYERDLAALDLALRSPLDANHSGDHDLMRLLLPLRLAAAQWQDIEAVTSDYETQLAAMRATLFEAFRRNTISENARRAGWRGVERETYQDTSARIEDIHKQYQAVAELNHRTAANLIAALPAEAGSAFQSAYEQASFPRAFTDRASMDAALAKAAALHDLTPDQQGRIGQLRAEFVANYEDVRRGMIEVCAAVKPDVPTVGKTITLERAAGEERYALEFDRWSDERSQINRRALRGLRLILTPEQFERVQVTRE